MTVNSKTWIVHRKQPSIFTVISTQSCQVPNSSYSLRRNANVSIPTSSIMHSIRANRKAASIKYARPRKPSYTTTTFHTLLLQSGHTNNFSPSFLHIASHHITLVLLGGVYVSSPTSATKCNSPKWNSATATAARRREKTVSFCALKILSTKEG